MWDQSNEGALDFILAKFSLVFPKEICFFAYYKEEDLLWNTEMFPIHLYVCHLCQSVAFAMLRGWDSFSEGEGLFSDQTQVIISPAIENEAK